MTPKRFEMRGRERPRGARRPHVWLRCSECGERVTPREARVLVDGAWQDGIIHCAVHRDAPAIEWTSPGKQGIGLCYAFLERAWRAGGEAAVAEMCERPDPVYWPGIDAEGGNALVLARFFWDRWPRPENEAKPAGVPSLY